MIAVDIAILPPEPIKSLAIELSKKLNDSDFHLNKTDILPHITLGIGFVKEIENLEFRREVLLRKIENLVKKFPPLEITVERIEKRYLMCKKTDELYRLHKAICDAADFKKTEDIDGAYFGEVDEGTVEFTNNFKSRNAYENWVPHITIGWDDEKVISEEWLVDSANLPISFTAKEITLCQLGKFNTCRKILASFEFG